ncbi:MAG: EscU/YscU/HrcU family type III secretion system export apparatus switch protein [Lentisphaeraceae bacterium]|nr:EscU/YscU/HrcU family type III secretion system export apparatus switch protein [Lentisphaeraceae bacterium]
MANPDPSKTEEPTEKKLSEARNSGDIPVSQDTTSVASLMSVTILLIFLAPHFMNSFTEVFLACFALSEMQEWTSKDLQEGAMNGVMLFSKSLIALIFGLSLASLISIRVQVGGFFDTKPLEWKFDSLNPANGLKQLLPDKQKMFKFGLTMAKVIILSIVCYYIIKSDLPEIMSMATVPVYIGTEIMMNLTMQLCFIVLSIFLVLSIIDIIWKRKSHTEKLMMTKDEVKDERKNADGDPKVKAKIKAKMREMAMKSIMNNVRDSDVVITNPTHVAVALSYKGGAGAPKVIAKGLRKKALRIRKIAKEAGVPIIEAPPLARSLYRSTDEGDYIDEKFFSAVAVILAKIFKNQKRKVNS